MKFIKKVLIAHQSTIPHYRVPFYTAIERLRPDWWEFNVVYDSKVSQWKHFMQIAPKSVSFNVQMTRTYSLCFRSKRLSVQSFVFNLWKYDLLVIENALNNISYPLTFLYQLAGKPVMIWGHGKDFNVVAPSGFKMIFENIKLRLAKKANGFFAYTNGVKKYLERNGLEENKIFSLYNTIDIIEHRKFYEKLVIYKSRLKTQARLVERKVLLYVGRLNRRKRLVFLMETFLILKDRDSSYKLEIVGHGDTSIINNLEEKLGKDSVNYHGEITDPAKLAPIFLMSDVYVFPGDVGLGPLQSLCYNLTPVVIESPTHNPEFEYLSEINSVILPSGTSPLEYANAIHDLIQDKERLNTLRNNSWKSIQHLTMENMAENFIRGINTVFKQS